MQFSPTVHWPRPLVRIGVPGQLIALLALSKFQPGGVSLGIGILEGWDPVLAKAENMSRIFLERIACECDQRVLPRCERRDSRFDLQFNQTHTTARNSP